MQPIRRLVSTLLAMWLLGLGNQSQASSTGVSVWTWMQRAFAPAHHNRRQRGGSSRQEGANAAGLRGVSFEHEDTHELWLRRALAPTSVVRAAPPIRKDGLGESDNGNVVGPGRREKTGASLMREVLCSGKGSHNMAFCASLALQAAAGTSYRSTAINSAQRPQNYISACAQQPHTRTPLSSARKAFRKKLADVKKYAGPLNALTASSASLGTTIDWQSTTTLVRQSTKQVVNLTLSAVLAAQPEMPLGRQGSLRAQGSNSIKPTAAHGELLGQNTKEIEAVFDRRDLMDLIKGIQGMTKSFQDNILPISPELISSVLDLAHVKQRLQEAHDSLSGSAGDTARGIQAASVKAFNFVAEPLIRNSQDGGRLLKTWSSLSPVLEHLVHVSKTHSDSASWLYRKAAELDPTMMRGAVMGISQATIDTIGLLNRRLETLLTGEVARVLERSDRELLGINRPNTREVKKTVTCMVMGQSGNARVLKYGDAIPQLLYEDEGSLAFSSPMTVVLNTDDKGNLYMGPPGSLGVELPLSSDMMWIRQMAAYSQDLGLGAGKHEDESLAPATVAAVTIPVNDKGDVLLTQRAFRGMYDGMWVFPGGHVDSGESLMTAAVREVREESGLDVDVNSLQPLAVWEGAVSSRKKQFCVIFFAADAMCDNAQQCNMELQMKEVHRAAWVPRDLLPRILDSHVLHSDLEIDGVLIENDEQLDTKVKMSELQSGLGEGHKFALRAYLDSLDKKQSEVSKTLQNAASFSLAERQRVSEGKASSSSPRGVPPPPPSWGRGVSRSEVGADVCDGLTPEQTSKTQRM